MKKIASVDPATFDGAQFAAANKIGKFDFKAYPQPDGTVTLVVPDSVPDKAETVFKMPPPSPVFDDAVWGKLSPDEKTDALRSAFLGRSP
jgi:hypothetical protein